LDFDRVAPGIWQAQAVGMAQKRTKADKALRQADKLEKKAHHPGAPKKKAPRENFSQAAARIVREATETGINGASCCCIQG
jgi:hypothetical protein